jgi:hypothetical protein
MSKDRPVARKRSFKCLQQFHISGRLLDLCTGGAYFPAVSNSGTPAYQRTSREIRRTDVMAKPSLQACRKNAPPPPTKQ